MNRATLTKLALFVALLSAACWYCVEDFCEASEDEDHRKRCILPDKADASNQANSPACAASGTSALFSRATAPHDCEQLGTLACGELEQMIEDSSTCSPTKIAPTSASLPSPGTSSPPNAQNPMENVQPKQGEAAAQQEKAQSQARHQVTVVSGYYPIPSKYTAEKYIEWIILFFAIEAPIVFFTTATLEPHLRALRGDRPIVFIVLEFEELDAWARYNQIWLLHHLVDPEKAYHSPQLYAIWAQKPFFVKRAIERNPFNTTLFFWADVGVFRFGLNLDDVTLRSFPSPTHLPEDRIIIHAVFPLEPGDDRVQPDGIIGDFSQKNRLMGGLWGGSASGCLRWLAAYEDMLMRYMLAGRFAGKDQSIMISAYLTDRSLARVVHSTLPELPEEEQWFFLTYLLSDLNVPYELDPTFL
jgi:desulfoferrodoxin (superoxide reductase-like protein)